MAFPTTNLYARYEAKAETGRSSGDLLATVVDQSGGGRDLTQAVSSKMPTWQAGVLNGHPAFRFDGVDDIIDRSSATVAARTTWSVSAVVSSGASEATSRKWPFGYGNSTTRIFGLTEGVTSGEWGSFVRTSAATIQHATSGVATTAFAVLTIVWDGATTVLYRNGTQVASSALAGNINFAHMAMGALFSLATECFSGDIALAAAWTSALDATARADLHSYVQDTYGITVADYASSGPVGPFVRTSGGFLRTATGILRPA